MNKLKKAIFVVNVNDYSKNIRNLTYPLIQHYAEKIGAEFVEIKERKFPDFPPVYEKLQIREIAEKMGNDWNIYIDSDAVVHPDLFDVTHHLPKDMVMHHGIDMASNRWVYDEYFLRDGRNIGSCNWFTVASDWCLDLWNPLDIPLKEAVKRIYPIQGELNVKITPDHLIDDYTLSRNIAKYGLKVRVFTDLVRDLGQGTSSYLWHEYQIPEEEKVKQICKTIRDWGALTRYSDKQRMAILKYAKEVDARANADEVKVRV